MWREIKVVIGPLSTPIGDQVEQQQHWYNTSLWHMSGFSGWYLVLSHQTI